MSSAAGRRAAALLATATCLLQAIAAADPVAADEPRYRILFAEHSAEPIATGEAGAHNAAEVKRMAGAIRALVPLGTVRFVFIASRADICGPQCAPEHLMWQRVNAATTLLRSEASRTGASLPFQLIGWSFLEELPTESVLPAGSGIDLRLHPETQRSDPCPWRVLVHDPALPAVIGARDGEPALPAPHGKTIAVSPSARVAIAAGPRSNGQPFAVWQDGQGEPRKVNPAAFTIAGTPLPPNIERLLLLDAASAEANALQARISTGTREYAARDRGIDDHVGGAPALVLPASEARCAVAFREAREK